MATVEERIGRELAKRTLDQARADLGDARALMMAGKLTALGDPEWVEWVRKVYTDLRDLLDAANSPPAEAEKVEADSVE